MMLEGLRGKQCPSLTKTKSIQPYRTGAFKVCILRLGLAVSPGTARSGGHSHRVGCFAQRAAAAAQRLEPRPPGESGRG